MIAHLQACCAAVRAEKMSKDGKRGDGKTFSRSGQIRDELKSGPHR